MVFLEKTVSHRNMYLEATFTLFWIINQHVTYFLDIYPSISLVLATPSE